MDIEQCKETYEMLKKGKQFIANIDKDFFLKFAEILFNELENKQDDINILQAQRDSMEYQLNQAKAELGKKDKRLNRQFKLLQKKDNKIEELKAYNSHQWEERCKLTFELEKKEAIINEMAEYIDKITFVDEKEDYGCDFQLLTNVMCNHNNCKECIKEYFTNKVESGE